MEPEVRAAARDDAAGARALVHAQFASARIADAFVAMLERAIADADDESSAMVVGPVGAVDGVVAYGMVPGAERTARIHVIAVRKPDAVALLVGAVRSKVAPRSARMIVAELPSLPGIDALHAALTAQGFTAHGRVRDYFAPGVDLVLFTLPLAG